MSKFRRRVVAVSAVLLIGGGAVLALSGLRVNNLGSDDAIVASCDNDGIDVAWGYTYNSAGYYEVTSIEFSDVAAACEGQTIALTLSDGSAALSSASSTVPAGGGTFTVTVPAAVAENVDNLSVLITG